MSSEESNLIEASKDILCTNHLELVCTCAGCGRCGGCRVIKLARMWSITFGARECKHARTTKIGRSSNPVLQCIECDKIVGRPT